MDTFECRKILNNVESQLKSVSYNRDLHKMYKNIEEMITNISKLEVECRRLKKYDILEKPIQNFTESVDRLEKLILIAKLIE